MKKQSPAPRGTAGPVVDPDLPPKVQRLLQEAETSPYQSHTEGEPLGAAAWAVLRGGGVVTVAALMAWSFGLPWNWVGVLWLAAVAGVVLTAGAAAWKEVSSSRRLRDLTAAGERSVQPSELTAGAAALLARAQQAVHTVRTSAVHHVDLIDRQRNEVVLPRQEWEIAHALLEYSRLAQAEPTHPKSDKVATLLTTRRQALRASLEGTERRVAALETYANQVTEADGLYQEFRQIQQLNDDSEDVLALLARTVRDDLDVAEDNAMTGEAATVAESLTVALESAKEAAVTALPAAPKSA